MSDHALPSWSTWRKIFGDMVVMAEREVGRDKVGIERTPGGSIKIKSMPKDFVKDGAADGTLSHSRGDDGSVEIIFTPRDAAPEPTAPAED